jgi:hypothetical protein
MRKTVHQTRENRTITIDFQNEATYFQLLGDGRAFVECVIAFILSLGFQLKHKAMCNGGGCLTRHSHYLRVRLGGVTIWRLQCSNSRSRLVHPIRPMSAGVFKGHMASQLPVLKLNVPSEECQS